MAEHDGNIKYDKYTGEIHYDGVKAPDSDVRELLSTLTSKKKRITAPKGFRFRFRFRYYSPFVTGHIYYLQTYGITFARFLSFLCLSVHTSPKYFNVSFSTSLFTSTYPFITSIVLSFSSGTSHVLNHLLLTMS